MSIFTAPLLLARTGLWVAKESVRIENYDLACRALQSVSKNLDNIDFKLLLLTVCNWHKDAVEVAYK